MKKLLVALFLLFGGIPALAQQQVLDLSFAQNGVLSEAGGAAGQISVLPSGNFIITGGYTQSNIWHTILGYNKNGQPNNAFGDSGQIEYSVAGFSPDPYVNNFSKKENIFIAGWNTQGWVVAKYDTLGNKQRIFGGKHYNPFNGENDLQFLDAITLDSQDRLLISSSTSSIQGQVTKVLRFLQNGNIDSTFGNHGNSAIVTNNNGQGTKGLHILSDGRIIAGEAGGGGAGEWNSMRFMPNGGPDYSYGDSGKVILSFPGYYLRSTIVQPNKKVLQCGDNDSLQVIRLKENGSFDSTFGINGKVRYREAKMRTLLLMNDGRILLGGDTEDSMFAIYRLMPNGRLDTTFGVGGMVRIKLRLDGEHRMNDLAIQADGKLLASGFTSNGLPYPNRVPYMTVVRFMPNGRLDVGFVPPATKPAGIRLYPNPTTGLLLLQKLEASVGKVQLQIVDIMARVVLSKSFAQMNTEPVQIEVGNLVPGMYQVIIREVGGKTWNQPFVKQ